MSNAEKSELITAIKCAVTEVFEEKRKEFYVEAEEHFLHHKALRKLINICESTKTLVFKTVLSAAILGALTLLAMGFASWVGRAAGGGL